MLDKQLTEHAWKAFADNKGYKDTPLLKALSALNAAERSARPDAILGALDELDRQTALLRKAHRTDKPLDAHLDGMDKVIKRLRASTEPQQPQQDKAAAAKPDKPAKADKPDDGDEGDDSPALLTSKLLTLLKLVAGKGAALNAQIALSGKGCAVLLSPREPGPPQRKLLATYLDNASGIKYLAGQCIFEQGAHTFVLPAKVGGLAKRLKAALFEQTGLRLKVRVRGEDPDDVDLDEDAIEAAPTTAPTPASAPAAAAPPKPADTATLIEAMKKLAPGIRQAAASRPALKDDLERLVAEFQSRIKAGQAGQARETLLELGALVKGATTAPPATAGAGGISKVQFEKVHLEWDAAKKRVASRLDALHQAILAQSGQSEAATAARHLGRVLGRLNEGLGDTLDALRQADGDAARRPLAQQAESIAQRYLDHLSSDALVAHIDDNPYGAPVDVRGQLSAPLTRIRQLLSLSMTSH